MHGHGDLLRTIHVAGLSSCFIHRIFGREETEQSWRPAVGCLVGCGYAMESAHEPAAKVSPPWRAGPLKYVHVASAEFFSRRGMRGKPAAADSQACDRRQLPKCQRATDCPGTATARAASVARIRTHTRKLDRRHVIQVGFDFTPNQRIFSDDSFRLRAMATKLSIFF